MDPHTQLIDTIVTLLKDIGLEVVIRPIEGKVFCPAI